MVKIIGYETVVVGDETVEQPIYDEPIIVIGTGENQVIRGLAEYEAEQAAILAEAEAERLAAEEAALAGQTVPTTEEPTP